MLDSSQNLGAQLWKITCLCEPDGARSLPRFFPCDSGIRVRSFRKVNQIGKSIGAPEINDPFFTLIFEVRVRLNFKFPSLSRAGLLPRVIRSRRSEMLRGCAPKRKTAG